MRKTALALVCICACMLLIGCNPLAVFEGNYREISSADAMQLVSGMHMEFDRGTVEIRYKMRRDFQSSYMNKTVTEQITLTAEVENRIATFSGTAKYTEEIDKFGRKDKSGYNLTFFYENTKNMFYISGGELGGEEIYCSIKTNAHPYLFDYALKDLCASYQDVSTARSKKDITKLKRTLQDKDVDGNTNQYTYVGIFQKDRITDFYYRIDTAGQDIQDNSTTAAVTEYTIMKTSKSVRPVNNEEEYALLGYEEFRNTIFNPIKFLGIFA